MFPIAEVGGIDLAFPTHVERMMPPMGDIPDEFKHYPLTKWNQLFNDWFFTGVKNLQLKPKEGIDKNKALRHIRMVMGSFEPQHEHKEAAVAFLLSEWFEDATWDKIK